MSTIELRNLGYSYAGTVHSRPFAISDLNITWEDGSANALLGPSGCGKTTLLNIISGLLTPRQGGVYLDGKDVTHLSPQDRHIAQVFQFPVVYDTMDVFGNLAFPLRNRGVAKLELHDRVEEIAAILGLNDILKRRAKDLTPAEKQKVALGRAIVRKDTGAVLLDEPLTVIDHKQRWELRRSLKDVQTKLRVTVIYVTHDQQEALTFADHVTIMKDGDILQTGTPLELYDEPASPFVGYFIGSPGMNILDVTLSDKGLDLGGFEITLPQDKLRSLARQGRGLQLGIRPERIEVSGARREGWPSLTVRSIENTGAYKVLTLAAGATKLSARVTESTIVSEGNPVWVRFPEQYAKLFSTGTRLW
ncbi:ABC transporter ATP-binding protein [Candidatus Sumerlaeota bacterium]|nr:ABC transporter ATP-binding protein [Candidatus Sumerlaeota bacterium]